MDIDVIMTKEVVSLSPEDSVEEAAQLLRKSGVSSLPVVDQAGRLVGILHDTDLLLRLQQPTRAWWQEFFTQEWELPAIYERRVGTTVAEVMQPAPAPVAPDVPVEEVAALLNATEVRELPVVEDGRLVGSVSRAALLDVVAQADRTPITTDAGLVAAMRARLAAETWVSDRGIQVTAKDGVLSLSGLVNIEEEKAALQTMARTIPGCRGVEDHLLAWRSLPGRWL